MDYKKEMYLRQVKEKELTKKKASIPLLAIGVLTKHNSLLVMKMYEKFVCLIYILLNFTGQHGFA